MGVTLNLSTRLGARYENGGAEWPRLLARLLCKLGVHDPIYYPRTDDVRCWWCQHRLQDGRPEWA